MPPACINAGQSGCWLLGFSQLQCQTGQQHACMSGMTACPWLFWLSSSTQSLQAQTLTMLIFLIVPAWPSGRQ